MGVTSYKEENFTTTGVDNQLNWKVLTPLAKIEISQTVLMIPTVRGISSDYALLIGTLLKNGRRVVTLDMAGCGENAHIAGIDFNQLICLFVKISETVQLKYAGSFVIFGSSIGGIIALSLFALVKNIDFIVSEGASVDINSGLKKVFDNEVEIVKDYYVSCFDSAVQYALSHSTTTKTKILLTWGARDFFVNKFERERVVDLFLNRTIKPSVIQVPNGGHFLQIGFPMSNAEINKYLTSIIEFLS